MKITLKQRWIKYDRIKVGETIEVPEADAREAIRRKIATAADSAAFTAGETAGDRIKDLETQVKDLKAQIDTLGDENHELRNQLQAKAAAVAPNPPAATVETTHGGDTPPPAKKGKKS